MCLKFAAISILIAAALPASPRALGLPAYTIEQAVAVAQEHNPEILIARKKVVAARGGFIEARSGFLPSLTSNGLYDKRQTQSETNLRQEDYNAILRLDQNLYTGGAVSSQVAIAQLNIDKANYELQEIVSRVTMDVRIAFNELLLNRAKLLPATERTLRHRRAPGSPGAAIRDFGRIAISAESSGPKQLPGTG